MGYRKSFYGRRFTVTFFVPKGVIQSYWARPDDERSDTTLAGILGAILAHEDCAFTRIDVDNEPKHGKGFDRPMGPFVY